MWPQQHKPIIGLAPMDGITDSAFRFVIDAIGHPSVMFTEFVSVEGLSRGIVRLLDTFIRHTSKTPLVGQLFGNDPKSFYQAALILLTLGLDGVDINMGCPNRRVVAKNGGASLINDPKRACEIIASVKKARDDWMNGQSLEETFFPKKFIKEINHIQKERNRQYVPVSVKTRIGYGFADTQHWISTLLETHPDAIELHGRTFIQEYSGTSNWEEIGKAADLAKKADVLLLGNGDVENYQQALTLSKTYCPDGVLIGRTAWGNPWVFTGTAPTLSDRVSAAQLHIEAFQTLIPNENILSLRKHMAWYLKGFPEASQIRASIMTMRTIDDMCEFLTSLSSSF